MTHEEPDTEPQSHACPLSPHVGTILALTTDDLQKASFPKVRRGKLDTVALGEQIAVRKAQSCRRTAWQPDYAGN